MRKLLIAATAAMVVLVGAPAFASGPSGSAEQNSDGTYDNQVSCGSGTETEAGVVYAGENGAEVCNDGSTVPVQGRVIATTDDGGYVAVDGDGDNPAQSAGWAHVDGSGVRCGDEAGRRDATAPTAEDGSEDCG